MSEAKEAVEYLDTYWSGERGLLETVVGALAKDPRVAAVAPLQDVSLGGKTIMVALIRSTEPLGAPPEGLTEEGEHVGSIAAGVFMRGPVSPTPLAWMDRLPPDRQVVLLEALDATPEGRRFKARMLAAREIEPNHPDTLAGITMMRQAGVLTEDEAAVLLA